MTVPETTARSAAAFRARSVPAQPAAQHRALPDAALPRRLLQRGQPVLRDVRQCRQHPDPGLGHRRHRGRPHLRHPVRRDRPVGRRHRQRDRHRGGLFHAAGILREHRQRAAAGLRRRSCWRLRACSLLGLVNAFGVTLIGIPSFIMTLAMMQIGAGICALLVRGQIAYAVPAVHRDAGRGLGRPACRGSSSCSASSCSSAISC